jgi:hypothetical protein
MILGFKKLIYKLLKAAMLKLFILLRSEKTVLKTNPRGPVMQKKAMYLCVQATPHVAFRIKLPAK